MSSDEMMLFTNKLNYTLPVPSSVVVNKTMKRSYFQNRSYDGERTMVCTLNTGSDYIDLENSSLVVKIKVESTNAGPFACGFGVGSACNIIRNIRINHRSGVQYTNTQEYNHHRVIEDNNIESVDWFNTVGSNMGYGPSTSYIFDNTIPEEYFSIPLCKVHPFFDPQNGVKQLPSCMASGLRIEIDLEKLGNIFNTKGALGEEPPTSYSIEDIYFNLQSCVLMDSASASINNIAQSKALEYLYCDIFTNRSVAAGGQTNINVDINKSVAFCQKATTIMVPDSVDNVLSNDTFIYEYKDGDWWYSLGSNQYPSNQYIDNAAVAYHNNLVVWNKLCKKAKIMMSNVTPLSFQTTFGSYSASFEMDTALELSSLPITSSRVLRLESKLDVALPDSQRVLTFIKYLASARTTLTTSRVDI